jgi:hypothetical protein
MADPMIRMVAKKKAEQEGKYDPRELAQRQPRDDSYENDISADDPTVSNPGKLDLQENEPTMKLGKLSLRKFARK